MEETRDQQQEGWSDILTCGLDRIVLNFWTHVGKEILRMLKVLPLWEATPLSERVALSEDVRTLTFFQR